MDVKKFKETEEKIMSFATSMEVIKSARQETQRFVDATPKDQEEIIAALKTVALYHRKHENMLSVVGLGKTIKAVMMTLEWVLNADTQSSKALEGLLEMWLDDVMKTANEAIQIQQSTLSKQ